MLEPEFPDLLEVHVRVLEVEVVLVDLLADHLPVAFGEEGLLEPAQVVDERRPRVEQAFEALRDVGVLHLAELRLLLGQVADEFLEFVQVRVLELLVVDVVDFGERELDVVPQLRDALELRVDVLEDLLAAVGLVLVVEAVRQDLLLVEVLLQFGEFLVEHVQLLEGLLRTRLLELVVVQPHVLVLLLQQVLEGCDQSGRLLLLALDGRLQFLLDTLCIRVESLPVTLALLDPFGIPLEFLLVS